MITTICDIAPRSSLLCQVIRAEYLEMPGLNLTLPQACRLWKTDPGVCRDALTMLVVAEFLVRIGGRYLRADRTRRDEWWS